MMKKVETDNGYIEGLWSGKKMVQGIDKTFYKTLEVAIAVKQALIDKFETDFGYSREMDVEAFDHNYSFNLALLDTLKEAQANEQKTNNTRTDSIS